MERSSKNTPNVVPRLYATRLKQGTQSPVAHHDVVAVLSLIPPPFGVLFLERCNDLWRLGVLSHQASLKSMELIFGQMSLKKRLHRLPYFDLLEEIFLRRSDHHFVDFLDRRTGRFYDTTSVVCSEEPAANDH
jgi:hypothetical protein